MLIILHLLPDPFSALLSPALCTGKLTSTKGITYTHSPAFWLPVWPMKVWPRKVNEDYQ